MGMPRGDAGATATSSRARPGPALPIMTTYAIRTPMAKIPTASSARYPAMGLTVLHVRPYAGPIGLMSWK